MSGRGCPECPRRVASPGVDRKLARIAHGLAGAAGPALLEMSSAARGSYSEAAHGRLSRFVRALQLLADGPEEGCESAEAADIKDLEDIITGSGMHPVRLSEISILVRSGVRIPHIMLEDMADPWPRGWESCPLDLTCAMHKVMRAGGSVTASCSGDITLNLPS